MGRRHRTSATLVAGAVGVSIAAMMAGSLGWRLYQESQLGRIDFQAESPLSVEIVEPENGTLASDPFTAPTRTSVALPEGTYQARVSAPGMLGQTFGLRVVRGRTDSYALSLDDHNLWDAPAKERFDLVRPLPAEGRTDLIALGQATLRRFDGKTGRRVWENEKIGDAFPAPLRLLNQPLDETPLGYDADMVLPAPISTATVRTDLVWACRRSALLLACSGKTGAVLWTYSSRPKGAQSESPIEGRVVGSPLAIDANGDGVEDLVATFASNGTGPGRSWVEAVSGRSGRKLWSFEPPSTTSAPVVVKLGGRTSVAVVAGSRLIAVDPTTGEPAAPALVMEPAPDRATCYADLDGDGSTDLVTIGGSGTSGRITAHSLVTRRLLWSLPSPFESWRNRLAGFNAERSWEEVPSVVDLDNDGRLEVIAPCGKVAQSPDYPRDHQIAGVQVLDGATGRVRWRHEVKVHGFPSHWFREAPDLDHDGIRDVVEASIYRTQPEPHRFLYIDLLSGKDGHPLWWWNHPLEEPVRSRHDDELACLRWWQEGPDGRPQLIVGLKTFIAGTAFILEGGSGRLIQTIASVPDPGMADLNGDGRLDLWGLQGNRLQVILGSEPELWRWLGEWQRAADYDGDGVDDLIRNQSFYMSPTTAAISGRDGRLLWDADIDSGIPGFNSPYYTIKPLSGPGSDLDGDGTPDLYATKMQMSTDGQEHRLELPVAAISGKTGRKLWTPGLIAVEKSGSANANIWGLDANDLDGDGRPEVLVCHDLHQTNPGGGSIRWEQAWLTLISGKDGSIRWHRRLDPEHDETKGYPAPAFLHEIAELDGDGVRDVLMAQFASEDGKTWHFELCAIDGRAGRPLWRHPLAPTMPWDGGASPIRPPGSSLATWTATARPRSSSNSLPRGAGAVKRSAPVRRARRSDRRPRWNWHREGLDDLFPIHLARLGRDERRSIVMWLPDGQGKQEILVLDGQGRVIRRRPNLVGRGLAVRDLEGDGTEELVFFDGDTLRVTREGCLHQAWSRDRVGTTTLESFGEIRPARGRSPATIIANQRFGLEGTTGRLLWDSPLSGILLDADNQHPGSLAVVRSGDATLGRLVAPSSAAANPRPLISPDLNADPRRIVPLPWIPGPGSILPSWQALVIAAVTSLGLLVFPGWLVLRALRRPWRVASLMVLPVASAVAYGGLRLVLLALPIVNGTPGRPVPDGEWFVVILALAGLPVVAFFFHLGRAAGHRRWLRVALYLGISVGLSIETAHLLISKHPRLAPGDRYNWNGWPSAWYLGAYLTGVSLIFAPLVQAIGTAASRGVRRVFRAHLRNGQRPKWEA